MIELKEVLIELSNNCNLSCKMCGYGQKPIEKKRFMSWTLFEKIISDLKGKAKIIRLNGRGESTIHPEFNRMLTYTKENIPETGIHLFTNLSFRNSNTLDAFRNYNTQLFVSIDSPDKNELESIRYNCDYGLIMNNLKRLSDMQIRPFLVFTIMEDNLNRIYDIANFAITNDLNIIYNTVRYDDGMEEFTELISQNIEEIKTQFNKVESLYLDSNLKCIYPDQISGINLELEASTKTYGDSRSCPSLNSQLCILYDGLVSPCNMFNPYIFGDLKVQSLEEIWSSDKRNYFIKNYKKYYYCKNCACMG
ncbi:MAG: SPASM domain-containing protein [bacterium]